MTNEMYMCRALALAKQGEGWASPNPMVGAVIVKNGRVIGEGWHARCGELHAERHALSRCTESPEGADIYVTLEPCCHHGKQPPCTDALIEAGIKRVFVGSGDPNPLVAGKGLKILQDHGIEVITGILEEECLQLNKIFFHYIQSKRPYVVMKYAMTMDGKIAAYTGLSKWITGDEARENVHRDRHRLSSVMVGIGTVLADDPMLNCRLEGNVRQPLRIVCDSHLRTPLESKLVRTARQIPTVIAACSGDPERIKAYEDAGCQVWLLPSKDGHTDLNALMDRLGQNRIDSVLLEGGAELNWAALQAGIVNKVQAYAAPKIFGGKQAPSPIAGTGIADPADAYQLIDSTVTQLGKDFLIESEVSYHVHGNR